MLRYATPYTFVGVFLMSIILVSMLTLPPEVVAQSPVTATVAYDNLNVRATPSQTAPIVGKLNFESTITVVAREDNEVDGRLWVWITVDALSGWVDSRYLAFSEDFVVGWLPVNNDLRVDIAPADTASPTASTSNGINADIRATLAFNNVNLRRLPHREADILGQFNIDMPLVVHYREDFRDRDVWVYVTIDGQSGWLLSEFVRYPTHFLFQNLAIGYGDNYPASLHLIQLRVATELRSSPPSRLRNAPTSEVLAVIPVGEMLYIIGQEDIRRNDRWYYVEWQGYGGWINWQNVRLTGVVDYRHLTAPYLVTAPDVSPALGGEGYIIAMTYNWYAIYVRETPSISAPIIGTTSRRVWAFDVVVVYGSDESGRWYYVQEVNNRYTGWMSSRYVAVPTHFVYINGVYQSLSNLLDMPTLPSVANPLLPAPRPMISSITATTRTVTPLRLQPASRYYIIERLPAGTVLELTGRNIFATFSTVTYNGQEYWLPIANLDLTSDPTQLGVTHVGGTYWFRFNLY